MLLESPMWNNWIQVLTQIVQQPHSHIETKGIPYEIFFLFSNKDYSSYPWSNDSPIIFWRQTQKSHIFLPTQYKTFKLALMEWPPKTVNVKSLWIFILLTSWHLSPCKISRKKASQKLNTFARLMLHLFGCFTIEN